MRATRYPECGVCGRTIYYDLWSHELQCAKDKQQREDAAQAVKNSKRLVKRLRLEHQRA